MSAPRQADAEVLLRQADDEGVLLSRRLAGRVMAAYIALLAGTIGAFGAWLAAPTVADRRAVTLMSLVLIGVGAVVWSLPWQRWPRRALLTLIPCGLALFDINALLAPVNPYRYGIYLVGFIAWAGVTHRRGTSLACAPLLLLAYLLPLGLKGLLAPASLTAGCYLVLFCALLGEVLGWLVGRLSQMQRALRGSEEGYRRIVETAQEGIWQADADDVTTFINQKMADLLGYTVEEMIGASILDFADDAEQPGVLARLERRRRGVAEHFDRTYQRKDGSLMWAHVAANPLLDAEGRYLGSLAMITDITERKRAEDELRHQALHDSLTGLPNRTLLNDRIAQAIAHGRRDGTSVTLLLLDLDRFKEINDTFGHHHGDLVLQGAAERVRAAVRATDTVARLGGDEFAVVLAGDATAGMEVARKIARCLEAPMAVAGQALHPAVSIGIAQFPEHGLDAATLLRCADVAMYAAKHEGQDVMAYAPERDPHSAERLALIAALRQAVARGALALHYQPQVDLDTGRVRGVEALVRWPHPDLGLLAPDRFIGLAEQTGQMGALTRWVLEEAIRQAHIWQERGLAVPIAVNLSASSLLDAQLRAAVTELLAGYGVPPALLRLEVTESTLMVDADRALEVLVSLSELGIGLAIDDYGTGYSSLAYLKRLPVDEIKIDRSFVQQMADDTPDAVIVTSTIGLAHSLERTVVAEGVESERVLQLLREVGCDVAQGYHLSRPLPAEECERWIRARLASAGSYPSVA